MQTLQRFLFFCVIAVCIVSGSAWWYVRFHTASPEPRTYAVDERSLQATMEEILQQNRDIDLSVSLTDLQTGKSYHYGESAAYGAASIGKLVTASALLYRVEEGLVTLDALAGDASVGTQLRKLIVESDNAAWHELNALITADGLEAYASTIGMTTYRATDNVMTSNDAALLLTKLAAQKLLNHEHTALLLGYMQQANLRAYIVAAAPEGAEVYHKTGYLNDRLHDVAIIKKGERSYVLAIFSKTTRPYAFSRGTAIFGTITGETAKALL